MREKKTILQIIPADNYWLRCTRNHETIKELENVYYLKVACFALVKLSNGDTEVLDMVNSGYTMDFSIDTEGADETIYSETKPENVWYGKDGNLIV